MMSKSLSVGEGKLVHLDVTPSWGFISFGRCRDDSIVAFICVYFVKSTYLTQYSSGCIY
jgi:hypothetical protein